MADASLYIAAGALVGALVGLTGVGGGSLMTPLLILVFGQSPSVAVGTDLMFASITKIVATGSFGLSRRVAWPIVSRLALGSLPAAAAVLGLLATARTPRAVIDTLNAEVHKAMQRPDTVEAMRGMAVDIVLSTPEEFGRLIEAEMLRWGKLVRALNLKAE